MSPRRRDSAPNTAPRFLLSVACCHFWLSLPGLPPSSTGARAERPCNPLTPASYRPGLFLAIDNNQGKEKSMTDSDTYRQALDIALTDLTVTLTEAP